MLAVPIATPPLYFFNPIVGTQPPAARPVAAAVHARTASRVLERGVCGWGEGRRVGSLLANICFSDV